MKTTLKILRAVALSTLTVMLTLILLYFLVAYVTPIREGVKKATEGTMFEYFIAKRLPGNSEDDHDHDEDESDTASPGQSMEILLSPTAEKNIGIGESDMIEVEATDFYKSLVFPAVVKELPGWSTVMVPSPASGVVTKIYHESGVSIQPGEALFDILLNQQEVIRGQTELLSLLKKREINISERERIDAIDPDIVPKQLRTLIYEQMEIDLGIDTQKKTLVLQGLDEKDIEESIVKNRTIIRSITVYAPPIAKDNSILAGSIDSEVDHRFTIEELYITTGKNIEIGESLCRLSDYCELAIQGKAFAVNERQLNRALEQKSRVSATFEGHNGSREIIGELYLRSIDNRISETSGALFCYVDLKNRHRNYEIAEGRSEDGGPRQYTQWHFKPGQRCELNVEYETLENCIVLPVDAVTKDLNEMVVFEWVGNEDDSRIWRKKPVHVLYRTKDVVAVANDGSLLPGAVVASKGASFLLAALEASNQKSAGGGGGIVHGDHVH